MTTHEKALDAARHIAPGTTLSEAAEIADPIIAAYLSALLPEDAAGLVEPLSMSMFVSPSDMIARLLSDRKQAASLIQSLSAGWAADKARLLELEASLEPFASAADDADRLAGHDGPLGQYVELSHLRAARRAREAQGGDDA